MDDLVPGVPVGGAAEAGPATSSGGSLGLGGAVGAGGAGTVGGSPRTGGATGAGGSTGLGGKVGAGGAGTSGGSPGTGGAASAGGSTGFGGKVSAGGTTGQGGTTTISLVKLTGATFGTGPAWSSNPTATFDKAFDGDITTCDDDSNTSGGYTGIDLGARATSVVEIRYYPRNNYNNRMVGGKFQCSTTSQTAGYTDLYKITSEPPLAWSAVKISNSPTCRYLRYLSPDNGLTNVAEIEFWGPAVGDGGVAGPPPDVTLVNLAVGKPVVASSQVTNGKDAFLGNDGQLSTEFCSSSSAFPVTWQVDLGSIYQLAQTDINFENAASYYKYKIDVSSDMNAWTKVVDQSSNTTRRGGAIIDQVSAQARYVQVTILGSSTSTDLGCFYEFLVWGDGTPKDAGAP